MADTPGGSHVVDPDGRPYDPETVPTKPDAGIEPLLALDLRVGTVVDVQPFPEARKPAWKVAVGLGPQLGTRWCSAQVTNYDRDELVGRQVVCAVNLGPRRIAGFTSEFLLMGGLEPDGTVRLLSPDTSLPDGAVVA